ncbi:protein FAR-RED IMPAIRED RESPONSE 1-like [Carya illinoinensis]|uniref:protein FAR-RED IMPAIRED RESPONSE 1-like n=1 Tax=Carya illinoinensis TaxID=32201 RepID=UPI001C724D24|nr:protein FAR-RED IMPAIRED RESPONSE 1-like [Carya illinoinensis]
MPPFVPSLPSPPSSNPEEFSRVCCDATPFTKPTFGHLLPSPLLSNPEEFRRAEDTTQVAHFIIQHSTMPPCRPSTPYPHCASEMNVGETEPDINISPDAEGMNDLSDDDNKVDPPTASMKFPSDKEVLLYYKRYAKQEGFGVIIKCTKRDLDRNAKYVTIGCARGGRTGIRMNKNFQALVTEAGGFENSEFQEKDCRNYIDKAKYLRMGKGGGEALNDYFKRMKKMNDGFVSIMDVDDEFRVRNVFWANARSRAAYEVFGDVITFDTTYLTNRYEMPFALFVGVNHHGQSILLGAGLISSKDTSTFVWLFEAWLECMNGCKSQAIITDQDHAMKNVIGIVVLQTKHRYCLWHIMLKLPEKLRSHCDYDAGLKAAIQNVVYDTQTCDEFEQKWQQLIHKYGLMGNAWLKGLYTERSFWVPVNLKGVF